LTYKVIYSEDAIKTLNKMDTTTSEMITSWVDKNLYRTDDPRRHGKALKGRFAGTWRYRVGDYRLFARIEDDRLIIFILEVRNRRSAYR